MNGFQTLFQDGFGTVEEKKSRFLGEARRIASEEEALSVLSDVKKRYYDARHHCYAYVLGDGETVKCSDDGEPQKTAGVPILNVIRGADITNVIVVVTRYFGGTLLGTGGLMRAYTKAALLAVEDGGILRKSPAGLYRIRTPYPDFGKIKKYAEDAGLSIQNEIFSGEVEFEVPVPADDEETFVKKVTDLTAGRAVIERIRDFLLEERIR